MCHLLLWSASAQATTKRPSTFARLIFLLRALVVIKQCISSSTYSPTCLVLRHLANCIKQVSRACSLRSECSIRTCRTNRCTHSTIQLTRGHCVRNVRWREWDVLCVAGSSSECIVHVRSWTH